MPAKKSSGKSIGKKIRVLDQANQYAALRSVCWGVSWAELTLPQKRALQRLRDLSQSAIAIKEVGE